MVRRRFSHLLRAAALVAALLLAQTAALSHSDREDSHPAGHVCALCVGLATFGAGNVAAPFHVDVAVQRPDVVAYELVHQIERRAEHRLARGPPQAS